MRPLGRKYVPVPASRSPVRHQASEQSRPVTRRKPYYQETLELRLSERRSPYRGSVGAQQPKRRQATSSPKRRQDQHRDSEKRRRLDAYHPRDRAVTVEEPSQPVIRSDGKSKISPHEDLTITVFQPAEGDKSQSGLKNQKQRRAAAKRLKRKEQQPPCHVSGCAVPNPYPKRHAFDCHVP